MSDVPGENPTMRRNVIILTSGLTGSSVLTGLIAQAGYWTGERTHKKKDYDTYENSELIELNLRVIQASGYKGNYLVEYSPEAIRQIAELHGRVDSLAYKAFLEKCNAHRPWIWKDPRLWLTIRFWKHLLSLEDCRFILLTRGMMECWISSNLRRQIRTYRYCKHYEESIRASLTQWLEGTNQPYLSLSYEALVGRPAETIDALNRYLETNLRVEDLAKIYHKPLYKNPRSSVSDLVKATLIYLKNYSERVDLPAGRD